MSRHIAYEFHGYRFEPFNARLLAGQDVIPLTAKASDTLLALVQRPGVIVTKQDLMAAVWPGVAVEENNLNQQISTLRKALSRDDDVVTIETVPRRGYRLVGPVRAIDMDGLPEVAPVPVVPPSAAPARRRSVIVITAMTAAIVAALAVAVNSGVVRGTSAANGSPADHTRSEDARARGEEMLRQGNARAAIAEQQEAIRLDPANARAYGSLAHALQAANRGTSTSAVRPAGQSPSVQAAQRGVDVDPACANCHGTLGFFLFYHDWQFQKADEHFQTAIRLGPDEEGIRPSYAMLLAVTGRPARAIEEVDIGLAREPYRLSWLIIRASALYYARRYEEAIAAADRALSVAHTDRGAWDWRSKALFQLGRGREALHALAQELFATQSSLLDRAVTIGGVEAGLRKALELTDDWRGRIEHSWRRASWRALLGDAEGAIDELERAYEHRRLNAINFGADPVYDKIRSHPRFQRLLHEIGLDVYFGPSGPVSRAR